jgi:methyl-accepting chemotaxis protein
MPPFRRRKFFIDKQLQTKVVLVTIIVLLVQTLVVVAAIFSPYMMILSSEALSPEKVNAARAFLLLHGRVWPAVFAIILLFGALSIFLSHRIVGPLYRIKKCISELADGNLNIVVTLRKHDELQDLADLVNLWADKTRLLVGTLEKNHNLLTEDIAELEREISTRLIDETAGKEFIEKLRVSTDSIRETLDSFRR